jgi:short subunit dehydrogenase-like uncharacterized protein
VPVRPRARSPKRPRGRLLLYGATGYTGTLIVEQAVAAGLPLILAGRRAEALAAMSRTWDQPFRAVGLDDLGALTSALEGVSVVLNAAGPFSSTAQPLIEACLQAGVHYLDISGEVDVLEEVSTYHEAARRAGVMLLPGAGFDVVPSDCLARRVSDRLGDARQLRIAISGLQLLSRGSGRTLLEQMGRGVRIRRNGELSTVPDGMLERSFDFGEGPRSCQGVSWGDVATAFHSTGVPNVEVYFEATAAVRGVQLVGRSLAMFPPAIALSRVWMQAWMQTQPDGPGPAERASRRAVIVAEAENSGGRRASIRARVPEAYTFTATCAPALAARVLGGELEPGFQTPARLYGAGLLDSFEGVLQEPVFVSNVARSP